MIRVSTLTPADVWSKPNVSEVAEVLALLKEYDYDLPTLVKLTGISDRRFSDWTAGYKKEPLERSNIPYTCWCFLVALVGRPNINGKPKNVNIPKVLSAFSRNAFLPANTYKSPSQKQLNRVVGDNAFTGLTYEELAQTFNWKQSHFDDSISKDNIPFLNFCLILMHLGLDIQKMILRDLQEELVISDE
ncbi:hypothetical protein L0B53_03480 [Vibrio sp. SS-MA-C1-2]|uniref:hypothetical protein n=1 Tax=Vibrio sp. SS-MA-C1-2 TaxID=2908646 RepID=UPI001F27CA04|nr:hypothetical protein [Vibrio sp. SS-MA-C1-2]UJF17012.1 hypothetical protein L0B53_03480 [Vibrio sp. SS-MA-C1-2]